LEEEQIQDFQSKALEIYKYFEAFCNRNNLHFFVCGGGCIGAVRHQGFIPWDDDIDVFMPRPDYEKLCQIWPQQGDLERYTLCRTNDEVNYHDAGMLLKDNYTTFINKHSINEDIHHGYMMDIIPLDGMAPKGFLRFMQKFYAATYSLFNVQRLPDNQGRLSRWVAKIVLGIFRSKKIRSKIWHSCQKKMSRYDYKQAAYITELVTGFKYMKNEYPKEIFSEAIQVPFETTTILIPKGYDIYLRMAFGDYMRLPPIEKRVPKHDVVFADMKNSYLKYRGVKYLKEQ
jgi:lipopolysaccharide cholinephosphotransferase